MMPADERAGAPMPRPEPGGNPARRAVFLLLGLACVGLGLAGAVLPVLPTTPFMILALWCFARSSVRFHNWLYHHPLFGPPLQQWERYRVIPPLAKFASVSAMAVSMVVVALYSSAPWYALAAMALFLLASAGYILSRPSRP